MKQIKLTLVLILSAAVGLGLFPAYGYADHLGQVTGTTCDLQDEGVYVDWEDLDGAVKYSVDFTCMLDQGDGNASIVEVSIGTSQRTDGGDMSDSDLYATYTELNEAAALATNGEITDLTGYTCYAKVKGLDPGIGKGRQNHLFSASTEASTCN